MKQDEVVELIQKALDKNEHNATENRKVFKEEMMAVVEKSIQQTVNGKIDNAVRQIGLSKEILEDIKVILKERKDKATFREVLLHYTKEIKWVVVTIGALYALKSFGADFINFVLHK